MKMFKLWMVVMLLGLLPVVSEAQEEINNAINTNSEIMFDYYDWTLKKEMELRKDGHKTGISPWALMWDDENYYLVSNAIQTIRESGFGRENIPAMMAAVVVISAPLIVLFLVFRKKIMAGVARGGTKG